MIDTTAIDSQFGVPQHLEHRLTTPGGRTLAVAEWGDPKGSPVITFHGTPGSRIGYWTTHVPGAVAWVDDGTGHMGNDAEMERDLTWLAGNA